MRRIPVIKVFFRKRKRERRPPNRPPVSPMVLATTAIAVLMMLYSRLDLVVMPHAENHLLETPKTGDLAVEDPEASHNMGKTPADYERLARETQEAYCQSLVATKDSPESDTSPQVARPAATSVTHHTTVPYGGKPFSILAYASHDIVSDSVRAGGWDVAKTKVLLKYLSKYAKQHKMSLSDLTFIDVGANIGWFSLAVASLGIKVIAVEPMEDNLHLLRQALCAPENQEFSSNVVLHATAASNQTQTCIMYSDLGNFGDGLLHCERDEQELARFVPPPRYFVRGAPLQTVRLDDVVPADCTIAAVKIDTEGHEALVLQGGKNTLLERQIPAIWSEFNVQWISEAGGDPRVFLNEFLDAGYTVRRETGEVLPSEYALNMTNWQGINDVVFEFKGKTS
eukprot:scaffold6807_cov220-Amphora_coffeaeformis.AAC.8